MTFSLGLADVSPLAAARLPVPRTVSQVPFASCSWPLKAFVKAASKDHAASARPLASLSHPSEWNASCFGKSMEAAKRIVDDSPTIAQALERTLHDALDLARAEVTLAKRELAEQARSVGSSAIFFAAAVMFLQAAITTLGVLLILMLRASALGFGVVGGLLATAAVLAFVGVRRIKRAAPLRAPASLKSDARVIAQAAK